MSQKDIEEESFVLGLKAEYLPLEPNELDRAHYNRGLGIYREERSVSQLYQIVLGTICFLESTRRSLQIYQEILGAIQNHLGSFTTSNEKFISLIENVPQFEKHTANLKSEAISRKQDLEKRTAFLLKNTLLAK